MSTKQKSFGILWALIIVLSLLAACTTTPAPVNAPTTSPPSSLETPAITEPTVPATTTLTQETTPTQTKAWQELKVHFIDVGQGDAILIDLKDIEVLIDGGDRSPGVVPYLKNYIDGPIEVMVATHPHADHIGGLIDVLAAFEVKQIWHNGETATSKTYSDFTSAVNTENAKVGIASRGNVIASDGLSFKVLNPANLKGTVNNNSIVLYLAYGDVDFLFEGDAEKEAEGAMLVKSDIPVPDVEILKVGHHGSRTASSSDFLTITTPEVAIHMAGDGNTYGHPHQETIQALSAIGAKIYGTDVHGNIIVATDGKSYSLQLQKQAPPVPVASTLTSTPTPAPTLVFTPTPEPSLRTFLGTSDVR